MNPWGMIAGAGMGLGKTIADYQANLNDRARASKLTRWSPWTGMSPNQIRKVNLMGNLLKGVMSGMMVQGMGQSLGAGGGGGISQGAVQSLTPTRSDTLQNIQGMGFNPWNIGR